MLSYNNRQSNSSDDRVRWINYQELNIWKLRWLLWSILSSISFLKCSEGLKKSIKITDSWTSFFAAPICDPPYTDAAVRALPSSGMRASVIRLSAMELSCLKKTSELLFLMGLHWLDCRCSLSLLVWLSLMMRSVYRVGARVCTFLVFKLSVSTRFASPVWLLLCALLINSFIVESSGNCTGAWSLDTLGLLLLLAIRIDKAMGYEILIGSCCLNEGFSYWKMTLLLLGTQ